MSISRRALSASLLMSGCATLLASARPTWAEAIEYTYDPQGRLIRVEYADGTTIMYSYDAAGNRKRVVRASSAAPFSATVQVTGSGPANLRALADAAGYTGASDANVTFQVGSAVTVIGGAGGSNGGVGVDTGPWPVEIFSVSLALQVSGKVYGGGGRGATGAGAQLVAGSAGAGGAAIYCRSPINITVNSGGQVKGGGGGGGGGWAWRIHDPIEFDRVGGGGGGGFPNGGGGAFGFPALDGGSGGAANGASGTTAGGGAGGAGESGGGGAGGAGGGPGANGAAGNVAPQPGPEWQSRSGSDGGAAGFAIRKNGHAVSVTNNGTITGTVG